MGAEQIQVFRMANTAVAVFLLTAVLGKVLLPVLRRSKMSQQERELGPQSHLVKQGTPTFGGLIFLPPFLICTAIYALIWGDSATLVTIFYAAAVACVGFADDYVKVKVSVEGLSPRAKSIPLLALSALYIVWYLYLSPDHPVLRLPFCSAVLPVEGIGKVLYGIFLLIYLYAVANAVNLTDGVDGLLSSVNLPVALLLAVTGLTFGKMAALWDSALLSAAMIGANAGFLLYNRHKAQVFMGDTGSLSIGALMGALAMLQGIPWVMLAAGIIYVAEAGSVLIQTAYFRKTGGKRIFRMSPIHHHYELGGWSEIKVVRIFTLVSLLGCLLGGLMLSGHIF